MTAVQDRGVPAVPAEPTDPPTETQHRAELHNDHEVLRMIQAWRPDELAAKREAALRAGSVVKVRVYTDLNGEATALVKPARAAVVFLAKRPEIVVRGGMPDPPPPGRPARGDRPPSDRDGTAGL